MTDGIWNTPFRGLAPFGESAQDALLFFGRETDTRIVVANALGARLTVLYGPSGVGKSSLLRAGVVRAIAELGQSAPLAAGVCSSWSGNVADEIDLVARSAVATALGGDPGAVGGTIGERLDAWTAALEGDLCLVLDQFEEVFTNRRANEVGPLLAELASRPGLRVSIVIAIRDDALAELDAFKALVPGLYSNTLRLDHLSRDAARSAILGPIERWNERFATAAPTRIDDELVNAVLDQVAVDGNRIETTYLQLVMQRIWNVEHEVGSTRLRHATLVNLGGARRIVADHLRRALDELAPAQQDLAAGMFSQLLTPSGRKIAHRVVDLADLQGVEPAAARSVLDALAEQRIVRPVGEDDEHGAGRYEIYHDVLCDPIAEWRNARRSEQARLEERALASARHRRLIVVAAVALAAVAVLSALTVYAFVERRTARTEARAARSRGAAATALTQIGVDPQLALALAVQAAELAPGGRVDEALREALLATKLRRVGAPGPAAYELTRNGGEFVAARAGGLDVLNQRLQVTRTVAVDGRAVGVSGDDVLVLKGMKLELVSPGAGATTETIALHAGDIVPMRNIPTGRIVKKVRVPRRIRYVALGPQRTLLAESAGGRRTVVIDARTGDARYVLSQPSLVTALAFGPGARTLAVGGSDGTTRLWRLSTGRLRATLPGRGRVTTIAFSPRATLLATAAADGVGRVWRISDGSLVSPLSGHAKALTDLAFSPNGASIATASTDGTVRVWKALTGEALETLRTPQTTVTRIVFSRGSDRVVGAGDDGFLRMWDARAQPTLVRYRDLGQPIERADWTNNGIAAVTDDGELHLVPVAAAAATRTPRLSPHGFTVAFTSTSGSRIVLHGHIAAITSAHYSADRQRVVTASRDGTARIWDAANGRLLLTLPGHFRDVADAEFSPDGRWVVTAGPGTAAVWDAVTGRRLFFLRGHTAPLVFASFDAAGRDIFTASRDGTIRRYACAICATGDALLALARGRLAETGRTLTADERRRYLGRD